MVGRHGRIALCALGWLTFASGCSHTFFQFTASRAQLDEIAATQRALVAGSEDPGTLGQVVDLNGRRGTEALIAGMTVEETQADPQYQQLSQALFLAVMGDATDPFSIFTQDSAFMAARVGARLASDVLEPFGLGGLVDIARAAVDGDGQRLAEMQASLQANRIQTCARGSVIVSYRGGILGHIHAQTAEEDPYFRDWRDRVERIHLVRFACQNGHVLMIQTHDAGESENRVIGWHFLSDAEWRRMEPQLVRAFDLPE